MNFETFVMNNHNYFKDNEIEFKPGRLSQSLTLTVMEQSAVR